jgi:hypothetical protein
MPDEPRVLPIGLQALLADFIGQFLAARIELSEHHSRHRGTAFTEGKKFSLEGKKIAA